MVYTGQPSKGCGTCRKRRIKCDEGKPECNNCIRIKQKCPGYKNHFDLAWRDQTSVAKKGVERGKQKRRAPRERETKDVQSYAYNDGTIMIYETDLDTASSVSSSSSPQSVFTPACQSLYSPESTRSPNSPVDSFDPDLQAIVPPAEECDPYLTLLRPIPEEQALCFFFNTYVLPVRDPLARKGFLEYLGPFYTKADSTSPVKMSTLAVAASMMATRLGQSPDTALSRSYYLRAVSRMKEHIAKQDGTASDELLVAVMLLQFYEASLGFLTKRTSNPHPHLDGALALIRHRGLSNFKDKVSKSILFYIRSLLIDEAFRSSSPLPRDVQSWSDLVSDAGQLPSFRLDTINIDLRNLQASAFSLIQSPLINSKLRDGQITKMIKSAISIDSRLAEWAESLPMHWSPIRVSDPELVSPTLQLYQEHCDVYKTVFISSMWNKLRLSQLQVQTIILACLAQQPQTPLNLAQQEVCQTCIQQLADDICASIPFFLGDRTEPGRAGDGGTTYPRAPDQPSGPDHFQTPPAMGGWSLMVPLRTLMGMDIKLRPGQREWIGGQMERTGKIYHIGKKK